MDTGRASTADERTPLVSRASNNRYPQSTASDSSGAEAPVRSSSTLSRDEQHVSVFIVGERLPYNEYKTVDLPGDLVKDSHRLRTLRARRGLRYKVLNIFDSISGWIAVAMIGTLMASMAYVVIIAAATVSDWKLGYCRTNPFISKYRCCESTSPYVVLGEYEPGGGNEVCGDWVWWTNSYWKAYAIYVALALAYGVVSSSSTTWLTKCTLPTVDINGDESCDLSGKEKPGKGKVLYMAAGSGIPEIKTILSGFEIPHFFDLKVLLVKGFGAIFAVPTGMCLGKEGPFVHMSTCIGYLVGKRFKKYRTNRRKMRELLSAACACGLTVAFGAPIGGVLFSYEEISSYFSRKVLWKAYICSLFAAIALKELNPNHNGKLIIYGTNYDTSYKPLHYMVFIFLGIAGGIFGGLFCKANFHWSKWFRSLPGIKGRPVFEVFLIVLATASLQFPNPLTRDPGDAILKNLLVDCRESKTAETFVCRSEMGLENKERYFGWLIYGTLVKLVLTIITYGCKVPSGVIIPALDGGAFFGRLVGQAVTDISPGIFAMVGAGAFLAGVSRMTISFVVIMFELTGEIEYVIPHMIAIMVAKWIADSIFPYGVYDSAQVVAGHPFLDHERAINLVQLQKTPILVEELIPPKQTMDEISVDVPLSGTVPRRLLVRKLAHLRRRGIMDGGLVLVQGSNMLQGYISQGDLDIGLNQMSIVYESDVQVRLLGSRGPTPERHIGRRELDLSMYVDNSVLVINSKTPIEWVIEMFGKLGLKQLCVTEEETGRLLGVVVKKRLLRLLTMLE